MPEHQRVHGRLLLTLGLIALVLSWGWHTGFYRPLFALPLMDKWRNPLKWIEITNFALVVLSAIGMERLIVSLDPERPGVSVIRRGLAWFCGGMVVVLIVGWMCSYGFAIVLQPVLHNESFEPVFIANIMDTMHSSILIAIMLAAALCVVLFGLWSPAKLRRWTPPNPWIQKAWTQMMLAENLPGTLAITLAVLAAVQLGWVATQFIQPAPLAELTASNPLLDRLRHEGNAVRVDVAIEDNVLDTLLQNQFAAMGISSLEVSAASRIPAQLDAFMNNFDDDHARLWFLAGVRNVVGPQQLITQLKQDSAIAPNIASADGYTLIPTGSPDLPSHALVVMKDYLAKATFVPRAEFLDSTDAVLKRLKDPAWNPRATLLLDSTDKEKYGDIGKSSALPAKPTTPLPTDNQVVLETYTPTDIVIKIRAATDGFILINDQYDADWTVTIDGKPSELLKADDLLRAVPVAAGESTLALHYATTYNFLGAKVSATAMNSVSDLAMIGAWIIAGLALRGRSSHESLAVSIGKQEEMKT
jgi:hypothetical protein